MDSNSSLPRARSSVSQSAPTFALLSEIGESLDIDVNTGLPKLPVELPDFFTDSTEEGQPRKSVSFHPVLETDLSMSRNSPSTSATCPVTKPCSPLVHHKTSDDPASSNSSRSIDTSSSTPEFRRGKRGRHTLPLKNRSRSVFIRLQLPNARTPPLPHRNLSILGESDSSDTE